ncbi:MAG: hypothetical protein V4476_01280 [Pseudomonadota bacterium]
MPPSRPPLRPGHRQYGAALLLLLLTLSLGAATLLMAQFDGGRRNAEQLRRTLLSLAAAKEALVGYAMTHGRLPRPASSATDGQENPAACTSEASCTGFLPWVTLGIDGGDGWAKLLRYSVTPSFTRAPLKPASVSANKRIWGRGDQGASYLLAGQGNCAALETCAPAVIFSTGKARLGTSAQGTALANSGTGNLDELQNNNGYNDFISRVPSDAGVPGGEFDDLVTWIPLRPLLLRMNAAGALF